MKRQLTPDNLMEAELKAAFTKRPIEVKKFKGRLARLKGMMTQWAPFKLQIDKYIAKKELESKQLPEKIARLRKVIKDECAHPVESLVVDDEYISSVHATDNIAHTNYYVECTLCKKRELARTVTYNSYGQ